MSSAPLKLNFRKLTALIPLLSTLLLILSIFVLVNFHFSNLRVAESQIQTQIQLLAENANTTLFAYERILFSLGNRMQQSTEPREDLGSFVRELAKDLPFLRTILVLDTEGKVMLDSRTDQPSLGINVSDRSYFIHPKENPGSGLYISRSVRSRVDGEWSLPISRGVWSFEGEFQGVVVVSLSARYLETLLDERLFQNEGDIHYSKALLVQGYQTQMTNYPYDASLIDTPLDPKLIQLAANSPSEPLYSHNLPLEQGEILFHQELNDYPELSLFLTAWPRGMIHSFWFTATLWFLVMVLFVVLTSYQFKLMQQQALAIQEKTEELELEHEKLSSTENELLESKAFLEAAWDQSQAGIILAEVPSGKLLYVNGSVQRIIGASETGMGNQKDGIDSKILWETYHPDKNKYQEDHFPLAKAVRFGEPLNEELEFKRSTGEIVHVLANAGPIQDREGEIFATIVVLMDITKEKRTENQLRELNERFELATTAGKIGLWDWDINADELHWDERMFKLYGIDPNQFTESYDAWIQSLHPEDRAVNSQLIQDSLSTHSNFDSEFRIIWPNDEVHWIQSAGQIILDGKGRPSRMTGVNMDITQRKHSEKNLELSLKQKEVLIRELYHRTKNTLQIVRSMIILKASQMPENEGVQRLSKEIEARIMAIALVHQKLYQAKDLSQLNMKDYLEELCRLVISNFTLDSLDVSLELSIEPIVLLIDTAVPCGMVITELLTNALKYAFNKTREGTIKLDFSLSESRECFLQISDNGVGLPSDWDPRKQESLGLQTIYALVERQMQGSVEVIIRDGLTWNIRFPFDLYEERV